MLASPFDALPAEQRERPQHVVEEATARVDLDASEPDDVPDEMLDELSQAAWAFAGWTAGHAVLGDQAHPVYVVLGPAGLPGADAGPGAERGCQGLMEDASAAAPYVGATMAAAAWKRAQPNPGQEESNEDEETHGT